MTHRWKNISSLELEQKHSTMTLPLLLETPHQKDSPVRDITPPIAVTRGDQKLNDNELTTDN